MTRDYSIKFKGQTAKSIDKNEFKRCFHFYASKEHYIVDTDEDVFLGIIKEKFIFKDCTLTIVADDYEDLIEEQHRLYM